MSPFHARSRAGRVTRVNMGSSVTTIAPADKTGTTSIFPAVQTRMGLMKTGGLALLAVWAVLGFAPNAHAIFTKGTISMAGARPIGMGGAFTSVADDSAGVYWNPAGIALLDNWEVSYEWAHLKDISSGSIGHTYPSLAIPIPFLWGLVIGGQQETRDFADYPAKDVETAWGVSAGMPLMPGGLFYVGGTFRILRMTSDFVDYGAKGFGGDAGFLLRLQRIPFARELRFGAVFQDFDGRVKDDLGVRQDLARTVRLGISAKPLEAFTIALDYDHTWNPASSFGWTLARKLRAGAEVWLFENRFAVRGGISRRLDRVAGMTSRYREFAGAGVRIWGFGFDYAWASKADTYESSHYLGFSFRYGSFGSKEPEKETAPEPRAPSTINAIEAPVSKPAE